MAGKVDLFEMTFPDCPSCANMTIDKIGHHCHFFEECKVAIDSIGGFRIGTPTHFSPKCSVVDEIEAHGVIPECKYLTTERKIMDAAKIQVAYKELLDGKRVTKKAICDLGVPFRDKYGLTDLDTLRIMRSEVTLSELLEILEVK